MARHDRKEKKPEVPKVEEGEFLIKKQDDGNWKGWTIRFGNLIEVREIGPETVLQKLLTHNGKETH